MTLSSILATAGTKSTPRSRWAGHADPNGRVGYGLHLWIHYAGSGFSKFAGLVDALDPLAGVVYRRAAKRRRRTCSAEGCRTLGATGRSGGSGVPAAAFETQP